MDKLEKKKQGKKKKTNKSLLRRISGWLHLWLGLTSGIVIFIIGITGAIYAFQKEIKDSLEDWRFVQVQSKPFAPPSLLISAAKKEFPNKKPTGLTYAPNNEAAAVGFESMKNGKSEFSVVFLNPYNASILKKQNTSEEFDFFTFVLKGHRNLWLPNPLGKRIIGISVIIFLVLLVTGLIMWWPKKWKKSHLDQAFKIKWKANFKRLNYDLHNVLGFYSMLIALVFVITGLVWSFEWFEKGYYYVISVGNIKNIPQPPHSDIRNSNIIKVNTLSNIDKAWYKVMNKVKTINGGMYLSPELHEKNAPIDIVVFNQYGKFYDKDEYFFDQYTIAPLYQKANLSTNHHFAETLSAMNYDLHTGGILGLAGKFLAFFISLICASLPITGFLVWRNKNKSTR